MTDWRDKLATTTAEELRGWWWAIAVLKVQVERDGERAAMLERAKQLGVSLA